MVMGPSDDDIDRRHLDAIADADVFPYWYDDVDEPDSNPTLVRTESCDLCVVGGGYTGLWTAIIAKERDPSRDVVIVSGTRGSPYDPSATPIAGQQFWRVVGKIGFDATVKSRHDTADFARAWPKNWGQVQLADYVENP